MKAQRRVGGALRIGLSLATDDLRYALPQGMGARCTRLAVPSTAPAHKAAPIQL
jgi:hypothetical protein